MYIVPGLDVGLKFIFKKVKIKYTNITNDNNNKDNNYIIIMIMKIKIIKDCVGCSYFSD